jgi:hypothetical protein
MRLLQCATRPSSKLLRAIATAALLCLPHIAGAEQFRSSVSRFSVDYAAPWKVVSVPDPSAELFLLCDEKECGPRVLLSFGAYLQPELKAGKLSDFLKHAKADLILQNIRAAPGVAKVTVLREGQSRLGQVEAYEVVAEVALTTGQKRIRHTFLTFNAGYVYNASLGCAPELHARSVAKAQTVLATHRFF